VFGAEASEVMATVQVGMLVQLPFTVLRGLSSHTGRPLKG
jgi:hypothetical protein